MGTGRGNRARPPGRRPTIDLTRDSLMTVRAVLPLAALAGLVAGPAAALDEVTFGTNWKAQAEHGGF